MFCSESGVGNQTISECHPDKEIPRDELGIPRYQIFAISIDIHHSRTKLILNVNIFEYHNNVMMLLSLAIWTKKILLL